MKKQPEAFFKRDLLRLGWLFFALSAAAFVFKMTPALSTPTLLSVVVALILSPVVAWFERRGYSRGAAIGIIFGVVAAFSAAGGFILFKSMRAEWESFRHQAPMYFHGSVDKLRALETGWKAHYSFLASWQPTDSLIAWTEGAGEWFLKNGPGLLGDLVTCLFVAPLIIMVLLKDGRAIRKKFFELVPNRLFESTYMVTTKILTGLSDYIRAKLVEALIVGALTTIGLALVKAPYAILLGVVAGATNIIPYVGPVIGAVPAILITLFDPSCSELLWPMMIVYAVANIIDMAVIFPLLVAKLVNLHPVLLIIAVMVGQQYYGVVGMLISIPVATGIKVIFQEIFSAIYQKGATDKTSVPV